MFFPSQNLLPVPAAHIQIAIFYNQTLVLFVLQIHVNGIIHYVLFYLLYALIIMTVRFIHVVAGKSSFILYLCGSSLNKYINVSVHSTEYLACFQFGAVMNMTIYINLKKNLVGLQAFYYFKNFKKFNYS